MLWRLDVPAHGRWIFTAVPATTLCTSRQYSRRGSRVLFRQHEVPSKRRRVVQGIATTLCTSRQYSRRGSRVLFRQHEVPSKRRRMVQGAVIAATQWIHVGLVSQSQFLHVRPAQHVSKWTASSAVALP